MRHQTQISTTTREEPKVMFSYLPRLFDSTGGLKTQATVAQFENRTLIAMII